MKWVETQATDIGTPLKFVERPKRVHEHELPWFGPEAVAVVEVLLARGTSWRGTTSAVN